MTLIWYNFSNFSLIRNGKTVSSGDLRSVVRGLLKNGVPMSEIETAVAALQDHPHNVCEFGVSGTFMYSEYKKDFDFRVEAA